MAVVEPTLEVEAELLAARLGAEGRAGLVIGLDEVGRGAIAGPVCVGAAVVGLDRLDAFPEGLRDSKLLTAKRREALEEPLRAWPVAHARGFAGPEEIEAEGIGRCLAAAAKRALAGLHEQGIDVADATILLDGSHDWLSPSLATPLRVVVRAKADRDCASVACAAVLAKLERDRIMVAADAEAPMYAWASNKGYASAVHIAAIREHGPHGLHRTSWLAGILADASAP